ncbi:riboflavine-aldehyde-forming enzyme [Planoprotostelium fungivorum]|uniref:Riboflavine-aldehyde-forming enzyme n=1 Tax=Planoprotostelium fungivorum TaxID=1890364 RepID=A0A2P6NT08_9EUKA|nr:riboflavine-aldehyde-forming enzyme [Planoprotostelium fungivorum]
MDYPGVHPPNEESFSTAPTMVNKSILLTIALFLSLIALCQASISGQATYFAPGLGACGHTNGANDLIAALNKAQYGSGGYCGKKATVHGPNGSVKVTIVDECPGCSYGDLDLSPAAFKKIADLSAGRVSIHWNWS